MARIKSVCFCLRGIKRFTFYIKTFCIMGRIRSYGFLCIFTYTDHKFIGYFRLGKSQVMPCMVWAQKSQEIGGKILLEYEKTYYCGLESSYININYICHGGLGGRTEPKYRKATFNLWNFDHIKAIVCFGM